MSDEVRKNNLLQFFAIKAPLYSFHTACVNDLRCELTGVMRCELNY
jgi:hypothetical protein